MLPWLRVDGVLRQVKDLWPVVGSKPLSDDESDSEDSARLPQTSALNLRTPTWPAVQMQMAAQQMNVHPRTKPRSSRSVGMPDRRGLPLVARCAITTGGGHETNLEICHLGASAFAPVWSSRYVKFASCVYADAVTRQARLYLELRSFVFIRSEVA